MSDKFLFGLAPGWALGYDRNQWILLRRRNSRTGRGWKPFRFVGSTKTVLQRVLNESGIRPSVNAERGLAAMEENFRDWLPGQENKWRDAA